MKKNFCATAIGSVPHTNAKEICDKIIKSYKDIPFWPQMPKRSFFENMYAQFLEGFPCTVIDEKKAKVWIDTSKDLIGGIEKAYQKIIDNDLEYFAITEKRAAGLHEFLAQVGKAKKKFSYLKGHVTGPVSFGLSVTDENKQSIFYHPELSEVLTKILAIKARYQIKRLKEHCDDVIIFIDEPYLVSIGSSVVNIKKEDAVARIGEIISAVHEEGALAGIHCCGNTDWSLLLGMDLDILNFDAFGFTKSLSLYPGALKEFLNKGKTLAWGIVPTSDKIAKEQEESLINRLKQGFSSLSEKGIEEARLLDSLMVTPSCGCGSMGTAEAEKVLDMNIKVSEALRKIYGR